MKKIIIWPEGPAKKNNLAPILSEKKYLGPDQKPKPPPPPEYQMDRALVRIIFLYSSDKCCILRKYAHQNNATLNGFIFLKICKLVSMIIGVNPDQNLQIIRILKRYTKMCENQ